MLQFLTEILSTIHAVGQCEDAALGKSQSQSHCSSSHCLHRFVAYHIHIHYFKYYAHRNKINMNFFIQNVVAKSGSVTLALFVARYRGTQLDCQIR